jgi:tRNA threonylcarbamoyladenosine dehydratase
MDSRCRSAAVGFVLGTSLTLVATWLYFQPSNNNNNNSNNNNNTDHHDKTNVLPTGSQKTANTSTPPPHTLLPAEIRDEQLSRHTLYFGADGMHRLQQARVCIIGLGGVGSHAAHMLARGGVAYLRLVDFDQVTVSSLNRHACAVLADVGVPKAACLARFLRQICPDERYLRLDARVAMYTEESGTDLLDLADDSFATGSTTTTSSTSRYSPYAAAADSSTNNGSSLPLKWDMVIDAIDDIPTKTALLAYCLRNKIRVISCMGAAGKADFTRLHCSDLRTAAKDPLATKLRQALRKRKIMIPSDGGDTTTGNTNSSSLLSSPASSSPPAAAGIIQEHYLDDMNALTILYCSEKTVVKLADFTDEQKEQGVHHFGAVDHMRIRVLPVLGTMPAIMGQALATMALTEIGGGGGMSFQPVTGERVGKNVRNKLWQHAKSREDKLTRLVMVVVGLEEPTGEEGCWVDVPAPAPLNDGSPSLGTSCQLGCGGRMWIGPLQIDADDIDYLMQVWRNRCAITGDRLGNVLHLVRWDLSKPSTCNNLVLISVNALKRYDLPTHQGGGKENLSAVVRQRIESRLASTNTDSYEVDTDR